MTKIVIFIWLFFLSLFFKILHETIIIRCFSLAFFGAFGQVTLNPCIENTAFKVVVLGSSTAAGAGPSHPDSAWVNKYRTALQKINPQNQVVNLAVGGFTTYRIMPNNFVAPAGRPSVDTLKNITQALSLNPDFIIINLPSNDRGWPINEQLSNFDSLYQHSWNSGVPMYICTTQPITSAGAYQRAVRDSIWAMFSPHVIEFFLPLADTNNLVLPQFAADAVHLTDSGHAVLVQQVINKDILKDVFQVAEFTDLAVQDIILPTQKCQDSVAQLGVVIVNLGDTILPGPVGFLKTEYGGISDSVQINILATMPACQLDTFWVSANLGSIGMYHLEAKITLPNDSNLTNNVLQKQTATILEAKISIQTDTLCLGESVQFQAQNWQGDTTFWYANFSDTTPIINSGSAFSLQKDTALFAQAVSGRLDYWGILTASATSNINFNGNMFNVYANKNITLDSIEVKMQSTGALPVNVYTKLGKYQGFETDTTGWVLLTTDTVHVANAGDWANISCQGLVLHPNDTVAFYVHLANSNQQLSYQSLSSPITKSTAELTYFSGAGSAFNFGPTYPNRALSANFHYSFGTNYLGECASERVKIAKHISTEKVDLGPDTLLPYTPTIVNGPAGFNQFVWVVLPQGDTISTTNNVTVDSTLLPMNTATQVILVCFAQDKFGCVSSDTIVYNLIRDFAIPERNSIEFKMFPNPTKTKVWIEADAEINAVKMYSVAGELVIHQQTKSHQVQLNVEQIPSGLYYVRVFSGQNGSTQKLIILQ